MNVPAAMAARLAVDKEPPADDMDGILSDHALFVQGGTSAHARGERQTPHA